MNRTSIACTSILCALLLTTAAQAETFFVNSLQEFNTAHDAAAMNDSIIWEEGTYSSIYLNISKDHLYIGASTLGGTVFTGASRMNISGDYLTIEGFQFTDGNIGTSDVINITGSHLHLTQLNIRAYTCYKYLRIREQSQYVDITYCNFENRLNLDDQNILSILVDDTEPGYHRIQYCSFKNFDGTGGDMGIEPIRIGLSTQADHISRSLVEYCYFTQCDGDGELISSKAAQCVYRFNTFENNSKAELVLRHGSEAIVYGNFFLNGKGGIRVREGQNHYIYNNYFFGLSDRAIYLQNDDSDPLDNINIAFNTIVDCSEVRLGGNGADPPTNVTFANNIFAQPDDDLFKEATGTETWIGNIASNDLGITSPASGLTITDPQLEENSEGYWGLSAISPAIDAAQPGYAPLPQFPGMDPIDTDILFDLMGQARPAAIAEKDLGCNEYPQATLIQPIATEENTGPDYNTSVVNNVSTSSVIVQDLVAVSPNPASDHININLEIKRSAVVTIKLLDVQGQSIRTLFQGSLAAGPHSISRELEGLSAGTYFLTACSQADSNSAKRVQTVQLVKQ